MQIAKGKGIWVENDAHFCHVGGACVYDWDDTGKGDCTGAGDHIGIVTQVNSAVGTFVVTEGNMSGGKVGKRTMAINGKYIRGFICPDFAAIAKKMGGGSDSAYEPLLRLLYDHEGAEDAMEYRVSDLAVAHVREFAGDTERGRGKIARMERTPAGEFLTDGPKTYRIHYDSVSPRPRRAGLLIDGKVGSSGEQLVLEVRASSRRTTVYGQDNTLGCLDFSNCEILYFPQDPTRWMMLPTTRSCRVPEGRGIDSAGIAPDVRIPLPLPEVLTDNVDTWTLWVAEDMKTEKRKE